MTDPTVQRVLGRLRPIPRASRNEDFGQLHEAFLIAAVTTILVIRTQLWLTNYPQLGGAGLHIAHLLYGGAFMVVALGVLVTLLGRSPRWRAALIGGIGFGFFIDELGKFITEDNNYFFRPAAGLIYLIFIGLFLGSRALQRRRGLTPAEQLRNAMDRIAEAAQGTYDDADRRHALELLDGADPANPLVAPMRALALELQTVESRPPSRLERFWQTGRNRYLGLAGSAWFRRVVATIFVVWALGTILTVLGLVAGLVFSEGGARAGFRSDSIDDFSVLNWATLASSTVSGLLVILGVVRLWRGDRVAAYRALDRALLISILVTRVFSFVESQFSAVFGLAVDLLLLVAVRTMAAREAEAQPPEGGGPAAARRPPRRSPGALSSSKPSTG